MFGFGEDGITCTANNTEIVTKSLLDSISRPKRDSLLISWIQPIIVSLGLIMNILFIKIVLTLKHLQSVTNIYLVHLAIADSIYILFETVVNLVSFFKSPFAPNWGFLGRAGCVMNAFVPFSCYYASLLIVTVVTMERYFAICFPFKHRQMTGKSRTLTMLMACWVIAMLFGSAHIFEAIKFQTYCIKPLGHEDVLYKLGWCVTLNRPITNYTSFVLEFGSFLISMSGSIFMFGSIIQTLRRRSEIQSDTADSRSDVIARQVSRMLIINGCVFFLLHLPKKIILTTRFIARTARFSIMHKRVYDTWLWYSDLMLYVNSSVNPLIYGIGNPRYRNELLKCLYGRNKKRGLDTTNNTRNQSLNKP